MSKTTLLLPNGISVTNNIAKITTGKVTDYVDVANGLILAQSFLYSLQSIYSVEEYYEYKRIKLNVVYQEVPDFICKQPLPFLSPNDLLIICALSKSEVKTDVVNHIVETLIPFMYHVMKSVNEYQSEQEQSLRQVDVLPTDETNVITMSSKEIAELTNTRHDSVLRTIKSLIDKSILTATICGSYKAANGQEQPCYFSDKRDSLVIVARLSPEFTAKVIDRWQELEKQVAQPVAPQITPLSQPTLINNSSDQADQEILSPLIPVNDVLQQIEKMNIPDNHKQLLIANMLNKVAGLPIDLMLPITYEEKLSPAQIAEKLGVSPQAIGRIITKLGIRGDSKYSEGRLSQSSSGNKDITMFYYTLDAVKLIEQALKGSKNARKN